MTNTVDIGHACLKKPRSWSRRRSSAETSTFLGVSRNTFFATGLMLPSRPNVRPAAKSIRRFAVSGSMAWRFTITGMSALNLSPISSTSTSSSSSSGGSTNPSHTRLFLNVPAMHLTYLLRSPSYVVRHESPIGRAPQAGDPEWTGHRLRRNHHYTPRKRFYRRLRRHSATSAASSCSTGSRAGDLFSGPRAENRRADAHQGGALLHRDLEVGGHAHRQRAQVPAETPRQL